jgi:long-chain acyl-CoA synthetase
MSLQAPIVSTTPIASPATMHSSVFADILGRVNAGDNSVLLGKEVITFGQLLRRVNEMAVVLKQSGVGPRTVVALAFPHCMDGCAAMFASYSLSAVPVLIDPLATPTEQESVITESGAAFLFAPSTGIGAQISKKYEVICTLGDSILLALGTTGIEAMLGDALIIYTSGTTGVPKGVVLTDQSVSSNVRAVAQYLSLSSSDRGLIFTPPSLAFAVSQLLTHLWVGAPVLQWPHGLMFPNRLLTAIDHHQITGLSCNPSSVRLLLRSKNRPQLAANSLRYVMLGGQPLMPQDWQQVREYFSSARVVNMYGCSENSPRISYHWIDGTLPEPMLQYPVGLPVEGTRIRIQRADNQPADTGEVGEVYITGTSLASRYWRRPDLTADRFVDGWFSTRDHGFLDKDGNLNLVGRIDTVLNVGHHKVAPEEVENVITQTPGVLEAAVAGQPDEILGTVPIALIVVDNSTDDIIHRVHARCCEHLSRHKVPRKFVPVPSIPRNTYGKIDRLQLQSLVQSM